MLLTSSSDKERKEDEKQINKLEAAHVVDARNGLAVLEHFGVAHRLHPIGEQHLALGTRPVPRTDLN